MSDANDSIKAYDSAYTAAMQRIMSQVTDQAELGSQVLAWIIHARRQLTTWELQEALGVEVGERTFDSDNRPDIDDIVSACAGLVTVDAHGTIRLVHFTTKEYFRRTRYVWFPDAETMITNICTTYLSLDAGSIGPLVFDTYAAKNWGYHAQLAPPALPQILVFLRQTEHVAKAATSLRLPKNTWSNDVSLPAPASALHVAAFFGLEAAIGALLEDSPNFDAETSSDLTPLVVAVLQNHEGVVKLLLDHNAKVNPLSRHGMIPLSVAARHGYLGIAKLLLGNLEDVEGGPGKWSPMIIAASAGQVTVIKAFLDAGVNVNLRYGQGGTPLTEHGDTPLHIACRRGHEALIKLLLEYNADVDYKNDKGETPLHVSCSRGIADEVELLLQAGANVYCETDAELTPLHFACHAGTESVVKRLLDAGADAKTGHGNGMCLLYIASRSAHEAIVKLLLSVGVGINCSTDTTRYPLLGAVKARSPAIVKLLLGAGMKPHLRDESGHSLLHHACYHRRDGGLVKLLLEAGVDHSTVNIEGRTALHVACSTSNESAVRLLLAAGAEVDCQDQYGETPLLIAHHAYFEPIILCLVDAGADVHLPNLRGVSAVTSVCVSRSRSLLKFMLCSSARRGQTTIVRSRRGSV